MQNGLFAEKKGNEGVEFDDLNGVNDSSRVGLMLAQKKGIQKYLV